MPNLTCGCLIGDLEIAWNANGISDGLNSRPE